MKQLKDESVAAYDDFMARDPYRFCKAFIKTKTSTNTVDNNICEVFNLLLSTLGHFQL